MASVFETSCRNCVNALLDGNLQPVQVGCRLGRLDGFAANGATVESEFGSLVVKGRLCNAKWLTDSDLGGLPPDEAAAESRRRALVRVDAVVVGTAGAPDTVRDLAAQTTPCRRLHLVVPPGPTDPEAAAALSNSGLPWTVRRLVDPEAPYGVGVDLTAAAADKGCQYLLVVPAGTRLSPDLLSRVDELANDHMVRFTALRLTGLPPKTAGLVSPATLLGCGGWGDDGPWDRLAALLEAQDAAHLLGTL